MTPRVRFAPSPTGYLHVGNARAAVANALFAAREGGTFLLRLDDTDTARCRPEYEAAIAEDLRWLGITWAEGPLHQRDRLPLYAAAAETLKASGRLYPCWETEEELSFKRQQRLKRGLAPIYDRAALALNPEQRAKALASDRPPHWRFRLSDGQAVWDDLVLGHRAVKLGAVSDPVLVRADGMPLYTFASVVDDLETRITHVIRGEDHVTNTGVQRDIIAALGAKPDAMRFAHLPLLVGADGEPLSKRLGALSLRAMRGDGIEAEAVVAYLARLGTASDIAPATWDELTVGFAFGAISRSPARFDPGQLLALNRRVLHALPFEAVRARLPEGAGEAFWHAIRGNLDMLSEARHWWDVVSGSIVPPPVEAAEDRAFLAEAASALPGGAYDGTTFKAWTAVLTAATGRKGKALFRPLRLALTGEEHGPELKDLLPLMGRDRAFLRLAQASGGVS